MSEAEENDAALEAAKKGTMSDTDIIRGVTGLTPGEKVALSFLGFILLLIGIAYCSLYVWPIFTYQNVLGISTGVVTGVNWWQIGTYVFGVILYIWFVIGNATEGYNENMLRCQFRNEDGDTELLEGWRVREYKWKKIDDESKENYTEAIGEEHLQKAIDKELPKDLVVRECQNAIFLGSGYHVDSLPGFIGWLFKIEVKVFQAIRKGKGMLPNPKDPESPRVVDVLLCPRHSSSGEDEKFVPDLTARIAYLENKNSLWIPPNVFKGYLQDLSDMEKMVIIRYTEDTIIGAIKKIRERKVKGEAKIDLKGIWAKYKNWIIGILLLGFLYMVLAWVFHLPPLGWTIPGVI